MNNCCPAWAIKKYTNINIYIKFVGEFMLHFHLQIELLDHTELFTQHQEKMLSSFLF